MHTALRNNSCNKSVLLDWNTQSRNLIVSYLCVKITIIQY